MHELIIAGLTTNEAMKDNFFFASSSLSSPSSAVSPLCHNLFAMYNEITGLWYPPNHQFKITEETSLRVHYRMRYDTTLAP